MLLSLEVSLIVAMILALASRHFLMQRYGEAAGLLTDTAVALAIPALIAVLIMHGELSAHNRMAHELNQSIALIDKGQAVWARRIYLDHLLVSDVQWRWTSVEEGAALLLAGAAAGYRLPWLWAGYRQRVTSREEQRP